ncbi:unnamed protein product [Moneuplotes crassus]|uniref:Uncharacterized protein n=1 Tax=Euplotes crassus TaxID=5936 RepID=A0AAD2D8P0_EUPCR|nr:unnamed protein product [Moneuplotes crassus]
MKRGRTTIKNDDKKMGNKDFTFFKNFEEFDKRIRIKENVEKTILSTLILKIENATYKSTLKSKSLEEILISSTQTEDKVPKYAKNVLKFLNTPHMVCQGLVESDLDLLIALRVTCFIILFTQCKEQKKIKYFIRCAEQQSDHEVSFEDTEYSSEVVFYNKDKKLLKVMAEIYASAIIPFIQITKQDLKMYKDFRDFELAATTNPQIFHDFSKFMACEYLFERDSVSEYSGSSKRILNKKEFGELLLIKYKYVFEPRIIRRKFTEFVDSHEFQAFRNPTIFGDPSIVPDSEQMSIRNTIDGEYLKGPFYKDNNVHDIPIPKSGKNSELLDQDFPKRRERVDKFKANRSDKKSKEKKAQYQEGGSGSAACLDNSSESEDPKSSKTRYRADDTINLFRKSNLSFVGVTKDYKNEDEFIKDLKRRYGSKLIALFKTLFDVSIIEGKYKCDYRACKIPYIKSDSFNSSEEERKDSKRCNQEFNHSFKFLKMAAVEESSSSLITGQNYLKKVITNNTIPKDFQKFYNNTYNGSGILNCYLRILEVYYELRYENLDYMNFAKNHKKIKFFETCIFSELRKEHSTGEISQNLDEELQDCKDYDYLIIPITKRQVPYLFIVDQSKSQLRVILYYIETSIKSDYEERMTELSGIILTLLKPRELPDSSNEKTGSKSMKEFNEQNVTGQSVKVQSLAQMCEVVEKVVMGDKRKLSKMNEEEVRHKIIDVILSVYLLC